jgi:hypothetical protein
LRLDQIQHLNTLSENMIKSYVNMVEIKPKDDLTTNEQVPMGSTLH